MNIFMGLRSTQKGGGLPARCAVKRLFALHCLPSYYLLFTVFALPGSVRGQGGPGFEQLGLEEGVTAPGRGVGLDVP